MTPKHWITTVAAAALAAAAALSPAVARADDETPQARRERALKRINEWFHDNKNVETRDYSSLDTSGAENDADLLLLGELPELTRLEIIPSYNTFTDYYKFTNAGFAFLAKTKQLTSLKIYPSISLNYPNVDENFLKYLEDLPKLRNFYLGDIPITDRGLASLGKIKSIQSIDLTSAGSISAAGLRHLEGLPNLFEMYLGCSDKKYLDLAAVSKLSELEVLRLRGAKIRGKDLAQLKSIKHLRRLNLYGATIEGGLESLMELPRLRELDLTATNVTDQDMAALAKLPNKTELVLNGCNITDKGLADLLQYDMWTELQISGTKVTDAGLLAVDENFFYFNLQKLVVDHKAISDATIARIKEKAHGKIIVEKFFYYHQ